MLAPAAVIRSRQSCLESLAKSGIVGAGGEALLNGTDQRQRVLDERTDRERLPDGGHFGGGKTVLPSASVAQNFPSGSVLAGAGAATATAPSASDPELMRSLRALEIAETNLIRRVGRTLVFALAKQLNKGWTHKDVETASSPESLSMAADDFAYAMPNAKRKSHLRVYTGGCLKL